MFGVCSHSASQPRGSHRQAPSGTDDPSSVAATLLLTVHGDFNALFLVKRDFIAREIEKPSSSA